MPVLVEPDLLNANQIHVLLGDRGDHRGRALCCVRHHAGREPGIEGCDTQRLYWIGFARAQGRSIRVKDAQAVGPAGRHDGERCDRKAETPHTLSIVGDPSDAQRVKLTRSFSGYSGTFFPRCPPVIP